MRILFAFALVALAFSTHAAERFGTVDVFIQSGAPIAAWQIEIEGHMTLVWVENGDHSAFTRAPYYDRDAAAAGELERIVIADFSLADSLPTGTFRAVTLHVMKDPATRFKARLVKAARPDGQAVSANTSIRNRGETP